MDDPALSYLEKLGKLRFTGGKLIRNKICIPGEHQELKTLPKYTIF